MRWLHGRYLFGSFSAIIFGRERKKKIRENPEKKQLHRLTAAIGKTLKYRINTGFKPKNNRKKKRKRTDARDRKDDLKLRLKTKLAFLIPDLNWEKKKKKKRKKGCRKREREGDENAERIGYCPEDL